MWSTVLRTWLVSITCASIENNYDLYVILLSVSFGGVLALFVGVSVMGLVEMGHVIIYNLLLDLFTFVSWLSAQLKHCYQKGNRKSVANRIHHHVLKNHHQLEEEQQRLSLADTAELPPFDYVN